jgi:hypothetical protein
MGKDVLAGKKLHLPNLTILRYKRVQYSLSIKKFFFYINNFRISNKKKKEKMHEYFNVLASLLNSRQ